MIEIQQELFLLMTGLFQKGCNDPKFQDLPSVRFYREICKIADQRATPDPAILWSYPWGQEQKEEYYRDGNIKIYHTLYNDILKNPIIIRKEKRKLEKELESSLAGEDDPSLAYKIQLLHDLAYSSKDKTLDENGDLCYRDSTNKPDFFDDPVKLPKKLTPAEMKYLPRCIREYTALSLFQEYFSNRKIFRRIKRPPSQRTGNEMAVGIFIMVLDFCITGVRSPGGKIPPKPHPSGSAPVRCSGAKPGSGKGPGHSPLQFQSDCRSQRWTGRRRGCWKRASSSGP